MIPRLGYFAALTEESIRSTRPAGSQPCHGDYFVDGLRRKNALYSEAIQRPELCESGFVGAGTGLKGRGEACEFGSQRS